MNPLQRLIGFARPYRGRFIAALAAMMLYAAASAAVVRLIEPIFAEVLPDQPGGMGFTVWAWIVLGVYLVKGVGAYFSVYMMTDIGQRVVRDIRNKLFRHILDQSAGFFSRKSSGSLMSRITNDVNQVQQAVSETLGDLLRESLALVGYAGLLFWIDWQLALVAITGAPLVAYPLAKFGKRIRSTTRRSQEELEHLTHVTAEAFTGHRIVKAFGAEAHEASRFGRAAQQVYRTNLKVTSILATLPPLMELVGGAAVVGTRVVRPSTDREQGSHRAGIHDVHRRRVHDVHAGEEAQSSDRQHAAGDGCGGAHLPGARYAFRGEGAARCRHAAVAAVCDRVPERGVRL